LVFEVPICSNWIVTRLVYEVTTAYEVTIGI
jgi:hypothetical protein